MILLSFNSSQNKISDASVVINILACARVKLHVLYDISVSIGHLHPVVVYSFV